MTEELQSLLANLAAKFPEDAPVRQVCEAIGADGLTAANRMAAEDLLPTLPWGTAKKKLMEALA